MVDECLGAFINQFTENGENVAVALVMKTVVKLVPNEQIKGEIVKICGKNISNFRPLNQMKRS